MQSPNYSGLRRFVVVVCASVVIAGIGSHFVGSKGVANSSAVSPRAGKVSSARTAFVVQADNACRHQDRVLKAQLAQVPGVNSKEAMQVQLDNHDREYQALRALGPAPEANDAYALWLAGVAYRLELERSYLNDLNNGRLTDPARFEAEYDAQLVSDNENGERFGLIFCASAEPGASSTQAASAR
ncbi:MAG: hypothetical protein JHD02_10780 [Thermoleophilaceae bacterium]|nr:hypothetical protein [Thermoleophilaceae bacterium]